MAEPTPNHSADEPMPPIPDGGLSKSMPVWLKQAPGRPMGEAAPETVDMVSLANSLELPPWLSALSERLDARQPHPVVAVAEPVEVAEAIVEIEEASASSRPLGASIIAAQQNAAERTARPVKATPPPIPAATPVDAEEFLRGGEVTVAPEPRSRTPFVIAAILIVVLAAAAVWYLGA
ncbi:MAG: hypothetical protein ACRDHN_11465 [Thermomicrobiales bacterium]